MLKNLEGAIWRKLQAFLATKSGFLQLYWPGISFKCSQKNFKCSKKLPIFMEMSSFFSRNRFLLEAFCTDLTTSEVKFSSRHSLFYKQILRFFEACLKIIHKSCKMGLCFKLATGSNKNIFQNSIAKLELKLKKQAKFSKLIELLNIIWVVKWTTFEFWLKFILIEIINGNANKLASQSGKLFCTGSS